MSTKKQETRKAIIYIIPNTKGGVGKTILSLVMSNLLHSQQRKFKLIEIDDNNHSLKLVNSMVLTKDNAISYQLDEKDDAVNEMFFDLKCDEELDYIIDCGGGNDTKKVLELLKNVEFEKRFLIPAGRDKKYIKNADETFELINDPENTFFVLNQYSEEQKMKEEFLYFFGNEKKGIESASKYFDKNKYLKIPFSNSFQIADDDDQTILDLALISQKFTQKQAIDMFYEKSAGDKELFKKLMPQYQNSTDAAKLLEEIKSNFEILFK